jgi:tetratricopeptide (TPR) repeat protein
MANEHPDENTRSVQAAALVERGIERLHAGDYANALADFDRALELDPQNSSAYTHRGLARAALRDYGGALHDYDHALELNEHDHEATYSTACAYAQMGQAEQACQWLERTVLLDDRYWEEARTDPDFDSIREHRRFRALLDKHAECDASPET